MTQANVDQRKVIAHPRNDRPLGASSATITDREHLSMVMMSYEFRRHETVG